MMGCSYRRRSLVNESQTVVVGGPPVSGNNGTDEDPGSGYATTDCLNHLEEDNDNLEGADIIGYEEPDLSGGIEGVDYLIVYGTELDMGTPSEESEEQRIEREADKAEADEAARTQFPPPPPMTQQNFVQEFSKLSRYAVEEVNTEDKKKKRFLRGLSPQFKVQLRMMRATEFQELVDAAITLEDDFKQLQEEKRKKAKYEPKRYISNKPNMSLSFKPRYNNNNKNNNSNYYGSRKNQAFQTANQ
ncbi:hypothetical protein QYE76_067041 [Lolium multiflorum]|uniref:Uncharacterized protein n=1 Tax=Lolium multiflorum TaxID=4521 RepID=A0AAD8SBM7_LOLMU|nr:hypothetical protein QYE76_067041 [Lolium multiflorum]